LFGDVVDAWPFTPEGHSVTGMNVESCGVHRDHVHAHSAYRGQKLPIPTHVSPTVAQRPRVTVGVPHGQHGQRAVTVHGVREPVARTFSGRDVDEFGDGGFEGKDVFKSDVLGARPNAIHRESDADVGQHRGVRFPF
jgi:hypothetical protein